MLDEDDPHAISLKTGERANMKLVRNSFYFGAQVHDTLAEAKTAAERHQVAPIEAASSSKDNATIEVDEEQAAHATELAALKEEYVAGNLPTEFGKSMLEGLGPGSPIVQLQSRLKSAHLPWYGTKAQCWQRMLEGEAGRQKKEAEALYREIR